MKKIIAKCISLILTLVSTVSLIGGCGSKKDSSDTLIIEIFDGGYGVGFVSEIANMYKEQHPGMEVEINPTYNDETFNTTLLSGRTTTDIFFGRYPMFKYVYNPMTIDKVKYECVLEDITDVYESKIEGKNITIKESLDPSLVKYNAIDRDEDSSTPPKYYSLPWIKGNVGLIRNNKVWQDSWKVPNTTDELLSLCEKIKGEGKNPFIYCLEDSYYGIVCPIFAAQYEGVAEMNNFWEGYDKAGNRYTPDVMLYDGELEMLKFMEQLLKSDNGYQHPYSLSVDFTSAQNYFLNDKENIAMMVNGDWLESEMLENYNPDELDIEFIKMPIISALGTKLGIKDEELSKIIDYVDGKIEEPSFTSSKGLAKEEVIRQVKAARNLSITSAAGHVAYIPVYSNLKEEAKDFLRLLSTDEGIERFVKSMNGHIPPYKYDYLGNEKTVSHMSNFTKKGIELSINSTFYFPEMKNKLFSVGMLREFGNGLDQFESAFSATNKKDFMTADEYFIKNYKYVTDNWTNYMTRAGLN